MRHRHPCSTLTDTLCPDTTLFLSVVCTSAPGAAFGAASGPGDAHKRWYRAHAGLFPRGQDRDRLLRLQEKPGDRHSDGEAAFRRKHGRAGGAAAHDPSPNTARDMCMACPALGTELINRTGTNRGECLTMPCD